MCYQFDKELTSYCHFSSSGDNNAFIIFNKVFFFTYSDICDEYIITANEEVDYMKSLA